MIRQSNFTAVRLPCPNPQCANDRKLNQSFCWRCWKQLPEGMQRRLLEATTRRVQAKGLARKIVAIQRHKQAIQRAADFLMQLDESGSLIFQ